MCKCLPEHSVVSMYHTQICKQCGLERQISIVPEINYGNSTTLCVGYSRCIRFRIILDQLFKPLLFGSPNQKVLFTLRVSKPTINTGCEMLEWLNNLKIPDKRYQSAHYYFAWLNPDYKVPHSPSIATIRLLEQQFMRLEQSYYNSGLSETHSFFSYNWLLQRLLLNNGLSSYGQFIKKIKCPKRHKRYENMYDLLTNACNALTTRGVSQTNQKPPVEPQDDVISFHPSLPIASYLLIKNHLHSLALVT